MLFGSLHASLSTGTAVPKRPSYVQSKQALFCGQCESLWISTPYNPNDDPPEHRLKCVDGWTPEYLTYTVTYWEGYLLPQPEIEA